jgi:hypothetical protein
LLCIEVGRTPHAALLLAMELVRAGHTPTRIPTGWDRSFDHLRIEDL